MQTPPSLNTKNFEQLSKIIENNQIQVSLVEDNMKREIERNRLAYAYPASLKMAEIHRTATKFGYRKDLKGQIPEVCPCCYIRTDSQAISIWYGPGQQSVQLQEKYEQFKLPSGIAVFLSFLKAGVMYLLVLSIFASYYIFNNICQLSDFSVQQDQSCDASTSSSAIVSALFLASVVAAIVYFVFYRKIKNAWHRSIALRILSEDKYTILISNIPVLDFPRPGESKKNSEFFYRKHLEQYLEEKIKLWVEGRESWSTTIESTQKDYLELLSKNAGQLKSKDIVKSITLCYNLTRLEIIDEARLRLIEEHEAVDEQDNTLIANVEDMHDNQDRFSSVPKRVDFLNDCRVVLNKHFAQDNSFLFNLTHFVGHAFVSFQYQHYRNFFLEEYHRNSKALEYSRSTLKIDSVSTPNDVNWKNFCITVAEKKKLHLNTVLMLALVLIAQFIVLFGLNFVLYNKNSILDAAFTQTPQVFLVVASILIILVNMGIKEITFVMVASERHKTRVNEIKSFISYSVVAQFLSVVMLFLLNLLLGSLQDLHIYANYFTVISSVLQTIYQIVQPIWIGREVRRWWRYRKIGQGERINKFQIRLNLEFQLPQYSIAQRYSYYLYKIYVAAFFVQAAPWVLPLTLITLFIMYWLDKLNLFYRCSLYDSGSISVSNHALKLLQMSVLIYAGSLCYFLSNHSGSLDILTLVGLGLTLIYIFLVLLAPVTLETALIGREAASNKFSYDDCVGEGHFDETFWNSNPATFLVQQKSVTGKETVVNPALLRRYAVQKSQ